MPSGNELTAIIKGNISDLKAKLSQADKLLDQYSNNIASVQKAIGKSSQQSLQYEKALQKLNNELKSGAISQEKFDKESGQLTDGLRKSQQETRDFQRELKRLQTASKQAERSIENLNGEIKTTPRSTTQAANATKDLGKAQKDLGGQVRGTVPVLTSFSQVVQDAPYGIQGVANNIQQLTMQFGYLQQRTGSAGGALKALVGGLTGPTGILIGVSLVSSALVAYGDEILEAINGTNELEKASLDYAASAGLEAAKLESLVSIANNENNSKKTRLKALDKINEEYGDYLGNLDLEALKTDKVRVAIDKLTESFFLQAKAKGLTTVLEEKYGKLAEKTATATEIARTSAGYAISRENSEIRKSIKGYEQLLDTLQKQSNVDPAAITNVQEKLQELRRDLGESAERTDLKIEELVKEETKGAVDEIERFKNQYKRLLTEIFETTPNFSGGAKIDAKIDPVEIPVALSIISDDVKIKNLNTLKSEYSDMLDLFEKDSTEFTTLNNAIAKIDELILKVRKGEMIFNDFGKKAISGSVPNPASATLDAEGLLQQSAQSTLDSGELEAYRDNQQSIYDQMIAKNNELAESFINLSGIGEQAIQGMTSILADQLLSGEASLKSFGEAFGEFILKLISQALAGALANAILGAITSANATGPAAIVTTPTFIASNKAVVTGAFAGLAGSFAQGGIVPGGSFVGDRVPAFLNSGEMILNTGQQRSLFNMLDGRTAALNSGENKMVIAIEGELRGETIQFALDRYQNKRNRRS